MRNPEDAPAIGRRAAPGESECRFGTADTGRAAWFEAPRRSLDTAPEQAAVRLRDCIAGGGTRASFSVRNRLASKPKWRMRRKPAGKIWIRNLRINSSGESCMTRDRYFSWLR